MVAFPKNVLRRDFVVREPLLIGILVLIAVVFSTITHAYSRGYDRKRNQLGQQWHADGNAELQKNRPDAAIEDFRTALLYNPQSWEYRLRLAEALTEAGHTKQALNYYQSLWQANPKSGLVNLHLARFAVEQGNPSDAERYFNGAVFGDWDQNAPEHRRDSLFELINFYLQKGNTGQAESQLMVLSGNLPEDPVLHTRVAELYSQVGDFESAFEQYRLAFRLDPKYFPAVYGAGKAAFHLGDYPSAESYLTRAAHEDSAGPDVRRLLEVAQAAAQLNPFDRTLPESAKIQRALRVFQIASGRLDTCTRTSKAGRSLPVSLGLLEKQLEQWKANANSRFLASHPDQVDALFVFATSIEKESQSVCGTPTPADSALLALANSHPMDEK